MSMQLFEWWNRVAYLGFRSPVVVHSSPGIGFPLMPAKDTHQLTRYNTVWPEIFEGSNFRGRPIFKDFVI